MYISHTNRLKGVVTHTCRFPCTKTADLAAAPLAPSFVSTFNFQTINPYAEGQEPYENERNQ